MVSSVEIERYWPGGRLSAASALNHEGANRSVDEDEARWIEASRKGDRDAFEALVKRYQSRVFRLAGRFFRRPEEIEDVAQETFLTVWRKLDTYRGRAPFEHWLTRVCLNCCYGRLRSRRPEITGLETLEIPVGSGNPELRVEVERLLGSLPPDDRFVLQLLHGEGWSTAEIAQKLGWSRAKVKVRAHRARQRLRRLLAEEVA